MTDDQGKMPHFNHTLSVVVAAYNEEGNLAGAVRTVLQALDGLFQEYEILIVNDGSTDGTGHLADRLASEYPHVHTIHNEVNRGWAYSHRRGVSLATKQYVAPVNGDNDSHPRSVRRVFEAVGQADIIVPYLANQRDRPLGRRIISLGYTTIMNLLFRLDLKYFQGLCVYPTQLAKCIPITTSGFAFLSEMLIRAVKAGYSYKEVEVVHVPRQYGRSKAVSFANVLTTIQTIGALLWAVYIQRDTLPGLHP